MFRLGTCGNCVHGVGCLRTSRAPQWRFTRMADERTWASFKGKQSSVESQAGLPLDSNGMQWAGSSSKGQRPKECPMPCHLMLKWHQGRLASSITWDKSKRRCCDCSVSENLSCESQTPSSIGKKRIVGNASRRRQSAIDTVP